MDATSNSVEAFFREYEQDALATCFASTFLYAGPEGAQAMDLAVFTQALPRRREFFERAGHRAPGWSLLMPRQSLLRIRSPRRNGAFSSITPRSPTEQASCYTTPATAGRSSSTCRIRTLFLLCEIVACFITRRKVHSAAKLLSSTPRHVIPTFDGVTGCDGSRWRPAGESGRGQRWL